MHKVIQRPTPFFELFVWDGKKETLDEMKRFLPWFDFKEREDDRLEVTDIRTGCEQVVSNTDCILKNAITGECFFFNLNFVQANFVVLSDKNTEETPKTAEIESD